MSSLPPLNVEQRAALEAVKRGENIFLSGPAGSGKSTLIRAIMNWANLTERSCQVTAMTGCAALILGTQAKTLHSWSGIRLGRGTVEALVSEIMKSPWCKSRWRKTDILIIDEVSMMTPELLEKLDAIGRRVRGRLSRPWGGLQMILCGDFFQLPPVMKGVEAGIGTARFAFDSSAWTAMNLKPVLLSKIERQTDTAFQRLLTEARVGELSAESIAILKSRQGLDWKSLKIRPTLLFSRNADVDSINDANLTALERPLRVFEAETLMVTPEDEAEMIAPVPRGEVLERIITRMDADAPYSPHLELCEGCQVMLIVNRDIEAGLVNGSRGVVVGFRQQDSVPIVQFMLGDPVPIEHHVWDTNDSPYVKRQQIPLRVAYAVTIHKSQGATLDCALIDIGSSTFECGQAYVAMSRVRNLESLYLWNFNPSRVKADARVVAFYRELEAREAPEASEASEASDALDEFRYQPGTIQTNQTIPLPSPEPAKATPTSLPPLMHESWGPVFDLWVSAGGGQAVLDAVAKERESKTVFPPQDQIFAALQVPLPSVRVVILAQDPYHGAGQAMGLAFSVPTGAKLPPSLKNIRKEFLMDGGTEPDWPATTGDLTPWVKQGVLLLNTVLTVEEGKAGSHEALGWQGFTLRVLEAVKAANPHTVFVAWGKWAQTLVLKKLGVAEERVLVAAHPSPLSANNGFFGSRPFSRVNEILTREGQAGIVWNLC